MKIHAREAFAQRLHVPNGSTGLGSQRTFSPRQDSQARGRFWSSAFSVLDVGVGVGEGEDTKADAESGAGDGSGSVGAETEAGVGGDASEIPGPPDIGVK